MAAEDRRQRGQEHRQADARVSKEQEARRASRRRRRREGANDAAELPSRDHSGRAERADRLRRAYAHPMVEHPLRASGRTSQRRRVGIVEADIVALAVPYRVLAGRAQPRRRAVVDAEQRAVMERPVQAGRTDERRRDVGAAVRAEAEAHQHVAVAEHRKAGRASEHGRRRGRGAGVFVGADDAHQARRANEHRRSADRFAIGAVKAVLGHEALGADRPADDLAGRRRRRGGNFASGTRDLQKFDQALHARQQFAGGGGAERLQIGLVILRRIAPDRRPIGVLRVQFADRRGGAGQACQRSLGLGWVVVDDERKRRLFIVGVLPGRLRAARRLVGQQADRAHHRFKVGQRLRGDVGECGGIGGIRVAGPCGLLEIVHFGGKPERRGLGRMQRDQAARQGDGADVGRNRPGAVEHDEAHGRLRLGEVMHQLGHRQAEAGDVVADADVGIDRKQHVVAIGRCAQPAEIDRDHRAVGRRAHFGEESRDVGLEAGAVEIVEFRDVKAGRGQRLRHQRRVGGRRLQRRSRVIGFADHQPQPVLRRLGEGRAEATGERGGEGGAAEEFCDHRLTFP